jgi:hypothetical protein
MTIKEFAELLSALNDGGKTAIHGDELGAMFPANKGKTVVLDVEAKARATHFAKACGCTFAFDDGTRIGTFTGVYVPAEALARSTRRLVGF